MNLKQNGTPRFEPSGVEVLCKWLESGLIAESETLLQDVERADEIRMNLEKNLIQAFSTPFDRGDIYSISASMDKVIEYVKSTLLSMQAYDLKADGIIISMGEKLMTGAAIKKREIYHHIKDASSNLEETVDILHRIVVRLT